MGEKHDGAAGAGGVEQVLLQGRRQSLGEVWGIERYTAQRFSRKTQMLTYRVPERYFKALKEGKVHGYLFEQQNFIPKEGGS